MPSVDDDLAILDKNDATAGRNRLSLSLSLKLSSGHGVTHCFDILSLLTIGLSACIAQRSRKAEEGHPVSSIRSLSCITRTLVGFVLSTLARAS